MNLEQTNHLENIQKAAENLNGIIRKTELIYSEFFSKETGNRIYIKPENLQRTGSFKIRGAYKHWQHPPWASNPPSSCRW